jgi:uncharacterized membrane protein
MKKTIYVLGIVSANLMLLGALLKALHQPGAATILSFSIFLFCLFFLPLALTSSYKSQEIKSYKWLYVVTFIVFSIDLLGALFKILHWPGASVFMMIGIPLPFVLFLPVYLYHTNKSKEKSVINNLAVMFGLTFLAVFSALLALNVSTNILDSFTLNACNNENSAKYNHVKVKNMIGDDMVKQKSDELCKFIDDLKYEILIASGNNQYSRDRFKDEYYPLNINNKSSSNLSFPGNSEGQSKASILKTKVGEYGELISKSEKVSKELKELTKNLFDVSNIKITQTNGDIQTIKWEEREFPSMNLIMALEVLSRIQSNVRFAEAEYLSSL